MATYLSLSFAPDGEEPGERHGRSVADQLRRIGDAHYRAAGIVARLEEDGWRVEAYGTVGLARHEAVRTRAEARLRLAAPGIDAASVTIETTLGRRRLQKLLSRREPSDHKPRTANRKAGRS